MFRLIVIIALIYVIYRMRGIWKEMLKAPGNTGGGSESSRITDVMTQCRQCETYFPAREGVELRHSGELVRFCSDHCRSSFQQALEDRADSAEQDE